MKQFFRNFYYSFPIQLLLLSFKRHQFLLLFWVLLFFIVIGRVFSDLGVPYLLLDPEYLEHTGYLSFALVGMGFGSMYVAWNLNCYMLHSHRFPFMTSFQKPMGVFFLNNSIIPLLFLVSYFNAIYHFQKDDEFASLSLIALDLVGFAAGFILVILFTAIYFQFTNKDAMRLSEERSTGKMSFFFRSLRYNEDIDAKEVTRVDYFVSHHLKIRHTRSVEHYDDDLLRVVYRQHHLNALFVQIVVLLLMMCIGFYINNPFFQIPTAASAFMFLSILISLFGAFIYWSGGWGSTAIIVFLLLANELTKYDVFGYQSRAYGLDYTHQYARYDKATLQAVASKENIHDDVIQFGNILENWRKKNSVKLINGEKPKLVFINVSGGGLRAAMFSTAVLQHADSVVGGKLFDKCFMISGASGGMFGVTYLRELFLQKKEGSPINLWDNKYSYNIAKDLLNPMIVSLLSNDAFFSFHKFKLDSQYYFKDRGYMFERQLSQNTNAVFDKRIQDYTLPEAKAAIPLLIYHTEVTNDARRFFISSQPISFLMRPIGKYTTNRDLEIDGIDFCRYFNKQNGKQLKVLSALRMNATFPFILPNPALPTDPTTFVLDGGALDNTGAETTFRVLQIFKDWINLFTSGVVIIQVYDGAKHEENKEVEKQSVVSKLLNPLGTIFGNMIAVQDFIVDQKLGYMNEELNGKVQVISFEYIPEKKNEKAALSLHLTAKEKYNILSAVSQPNNRKAFKLLQESLEK